MSAEQFLDGIDQVILAANSDAKDRDTGRKRAGMRNLDRLMRTLGRPKRDVVVTRRESTATTAQLIELSNGKPLADLMARGGQEWVKQRKGSESIIGSIFSSALGRLPSRLEIKTAHKIVGDPINAKGVEDLLWMLAMHPEFQLIH